MSAAGAYVSCSMFIYPRQRHSSLVQADGSPCAIYDCSKNRWTDESLFLKWLQGFKIFVKSYEILLILDNHHNSYSTLETYEFCKANYITMSEKRIQS